MENKFIRADDVAQELSVSKPYAYKLIRWSVYDSHTLLCSPIKRPQPHSVQQITTIIPNLDDYL